MRKKPRLQTSNLRNAKKLWGTLSAITYRTLNELTFKFSLSVANGDLQLLDGRWYVTHAGLLALATRRRCAAITTSVDENLSKPSANTWVVKATVYKERDARGFDGYGDASPANVSPVVAGAEMRVAETRAVNRALRKAYGIGLCSVEELGSSSFRAEQNSEARPHRFPAASGNGNGTSNGQPNLRDRLCVLIRKHELDPARVKKYAADFCGTESLRDAGRDLVQSFITTLEEQATHNRGALICRLNSYAVEQEAHS